MRRQAYPYTIGGHEYVGPSVPVIEGRRFCMGNIWKASNYLDSLTDAFYAGGKPAREDFDRIYPVLVDAENCGLKSIEVVREHLNTSLADALSFTPNLDHAKAEAGAARSAMQKILEGKIV